MRLLAKPTLCVNLPELTVRSVQPSDLELLWRWANDPDVRRNSISTDVISLEDHTKWFRRKTGSNASRIYILERAGVPIGQVRYDRVSPEEAEIGVSIAAEHRGCGFGAVTLTMTRELARHDLGVERVVGVVLTSNNASCATFRKVGFQQGRARTVNGRLCHVFYWPPIE